MNDVDALRDDVPRAFLHAFWDAAGGDAAALHRVRFTGAGRLPSAFPVTDFAAASMAAAGLAAAVLTSALGRSPREPAEVQIDRRLASFWFGLSVRPQGWELPPIWDAVAGDYRARDGWIPVSYTHLTLPTNREV